VNSVTFQVCNPGADNKKMLLTRDMVVGDFGIRETSVGAVGSSRTVSIKINHTNTVCPAAQGGSSTSAAVAAIFT